MTLWTLTIPDMTLWTLTIPDLTLWTLTIPDLTLWTLTIPDMTLWTLTIPDMSLSAGELNTPSGLSQLNSCLTSQPYLGGQTATTTNREAWQAQGKVCPQFLPPLQVPCYFSTPSLARWWHRVNALTEQERKTLGKGKGLAVAQPGPLGPMDRWGQ